MTELTQTQAREAVTQRWITQWELLHPQVSSNPLYVPYKTELNKFSEPKPLRTDGSAQRWVALSLRHGTSFQHTLGKKPNRLWKRTARIWLQVFGPKGHGLADMDDLCTEIKTIFEGESFGGIDPAGGADVNEIGDDGLWFEVVVTLPVTYYERK